MIDVIRILVDVDTSTDTDTCPRYFSYATSGCSTQQMLVRGHNLLRAQGSTVYYILINTQLLYFLYCSFFSPVNAF